MPLDDPSSGHRPCDAGDDGGRVVDELAVAQRQSKSAVEREAEGAELFVDDDAEVWRGGVGAQPMLGFAAGGQLHTANHRQAHERMRGVPKAPLELQVHVAKTLALKRIVLIVIGIVGRTQPGIGAAVAANDAKRKGHADLQLLSKDAQAEGPQERWREHMLHAVGAAVALELEESLGPASDQSEGWFQVTEHL